MGLVGPRIIDIGQHRDHECSRSGPGGGTIGRHTLFQLCNEETDGGVVLPGGPGGGQLAGGLGRPEQDVDEGVALIQKFLFWYVFRHL